MLIRSKFLGLLLITPLLMLGSLACGRAAAGGGDKPEAPKRPVVVLTDVKLADLYDQLTYPARVIPKVNTILLAESDGVVSRIVSPLGQSVRRGQKILTISHTDPVYRYAPLEVLAPVTGVVSAIEVSEGSQV